MRMEVLVFGFPTRKFIWRTCTGNKTARRNVASTKQFIQVKVHSKGGRAGRFLEMQLASRLFWNWILLVLFGLGGAVTYSGVVSNGYCFQSFGRLHPQVMKGSF